MSYWLQVHGKGSREKSFTEAKDFGPKELRPMRNISYGKI